MNTTRRRRYQSLGLMRKSHSRQSGGPVGKFVSDSQVKDIILYNRVSRARPGIRQLEFADDDVDWQLEYVCNALVKCLTKMMGWVVGFFEGVMGLLGCGRRKVMVNETEGGSGGGGGGEAGGVGDGRHKFPYESDHSSGDGRFNKRIAQMYPEMFWKFEDCAPFLNRRILKRKWLSDPGTREWAEERVEFFQKHVKRGFRTLCSGVGKDTKIYVVSSSLEVCGQGTFAEDYSADSSPPQTFIFRADSKVLQSHSELFRQWFTLRGDEKKIETSFVTPHEMQAVLVYMYTLTWPTDVMVQRVKRKMTLDPRFLEVLEIYGIPLTLEREHPPVNLRKSHIAIMAEEPPGHGEDENKNVIVFSEDNRIFFNSVSTSNVITCGGPDGQGDFSQLCQDTLQYVTEKDSLTTTQKKEEAEGVLLSSSASDSPTSGRSLSQFVKMKDLKTKFPSTQHRRVHPETVLTLDQQIRLRRSASDPYQSNSWDDNNYEG